MVACLNRLSVYRCNNTSMIAFLCFLLCASVLFLSSCGLEVYSSVDPPKNADTPNPADGSTLDNFVDSPESQEFEFTAVDLAGDGFITPGTDVYYRIYNNINDLQSDAKRINSANTENTNNAFTVLDNLKYEPMSSDPIAQPLIKTDGRVIIRLVSSADSFNAGISVGTRSIPIPLRYDGEKFNFDPSTDATVSNTLPKDGDQDYDGDQDDGQSYLYVNAYAVSTGLNTTFTPVLSELLSLGFIAYKQ